MRGESEYLPDVDATCTGTRHERRDFDRRSCTTHRCSGAENFVLPLPVNVAEMRWFQMGPGATAVDAADMAAHARES